MIRRLSLRARVGVAAVAWAVLLVALAVWSARHGAPTVREQTTVVQALPVLDRALTRVAAAAGDGVAVSVTGYQRTRPSCRAGNRDGEAYTRVLRLYTPVGTEAALADRIAAALPDSYDAVPRHAGDLHGVRADAGFYVRLSGTTAGPGELRFTADTGCRVVGGRVPADPAFAEAPEALRSAADASLARLGAAASERRAFRAACPGGGVLWTVEVAAGVAPESLAAARPEPAPLALAREGALAWTDAGAGLVALRRDPGVTISASSVCR